MSVLREGSDGSVITTRDQTVSPVGGVLAVQLDPGFAYVEFGEFRWGVQVPDHPGQLWDLIEAAVALPPDTSAAQIAAAVASYLAANPPVASAAWADIIGKPAVIAAGATAGDALAAIGAADAASVAAGLDRANHTGVQASSTISDFVEAAQDSVAALLVAGSGVTLSYEDAANTLTISASGSGFDAEAVRDVVGAALLGSGLVTVTVNDGADTITISTTATANLSDATLLARANHTGTQSADTLTDGTTNKAFLATERTKLSGIATGATANSTDATLLARANHTGTQAQSTVTNLVTDLAAKAPLASPTFTGTVSGVTKAMVGLGSVDNTADSAKPVSTAQQAALDLKLNAADASVTNTRTPTDGTVTTAKFAAAALVTAAETIAANDNDTSVPTSAAVKALVDTVSGGSGVPGLTASAAELNILDGALISTAELNFVDGVTSAIQTQLDLKAPLASPTFTGTVSGVTKSHVGLSNVDNTADSAKPVSTAQQAALDLKAPLASPTFTGTVSGVTKTHVGLGNVDNTSDANKPVSTATAALLPVQITQSAYDALGGGRPARLYAIVG